VNDSSRAPWASYSGVTAATTASDSMSVVIIMACIFESFITVVYAPLFKLLSIAKRGV